MNDKTQPMRDAFINKIYQKMKYNKSIFFLTADFGAPSLDKLRKDFPDRFINVGIAEQNLVNVATGLALEGLTVYAYAIAPFLTMRAFEQIRNLSLHSKLKNLNVNLIGVGAGLSYDVSGPTHHCLEDISIIRTLPNIHLFSPSDNMLVKNFIDYSINVKKPKYLRLDGKSQPNIYENKKMDISTSFYQINKGENTCIISTGYMTHTALEAAKILLEDNINIGVIDLFLIKPLDEQKLFEMINKYSHIITIEEGFINKGGIDSLISSILTKNNSNIKLTRMGFDDSYNFSVGTREYLLGLNKLSKQHIINNIKNGDKL